MTNFFKREPFTTLASGECEYHPDRDAVNRLYLPHMKPVKVCQDCYDRLIEVHEDRGPNRLFVAGG